MAVTPIYGIPYVESADLVANYPGVSEFLAEKVEDKLPTYSATAPSSPSVGQVWIDSTGTPIGKVWNGSAWKIFSGLGKVLQVVSVTKADSFSTTSQSFVDVTGLAASITPTATSSRILVLGKIAANLVVADTQGYTRLVRGETVIGGGTIVGSRTSAMSGLYIVSASATTDLSVNFYDSPASTSSQTYKIQARTAGNTLAINIAAGDGNNDFIGRTSSTITLMEISA